MLKVKINNVRNANRDEVYYVQHSAKLLERALNDDRLWREISIRYPSLSEKYNRIYKRDLNFQEFKDLIMSGLDMYESTSDMELDVDVTLYYSMGSGIGYTNVNTYRTWFNRRFRKYFNYGDMAGHIFHEYLHNVGFDHLYSHLGTLNYEVAYIVEKFIEKYYLDLETRDAGRRSVWTRVKSFFRRWF